MIFAHDHIQAKKDKVIPMIKYGVKMLAVVIIFSFLSGCNLFGPSEKDVKHALEAIFRVFEDSTRQDEPEVRNVYSNAADVIFRNDEESLIHEMSVLLDEGKMLVTGNCVITDHEDAFSKYLISGELDYRVTFRQGNSRDVDSGTMSGELTLAGGKVQTLEFSFNLGSRGEMVDFLVTANGKNIDFAREEKAFNFLRGLGSRLPG
ncbi:MAG: hypothetical protein P8X90_20925 [Desulfobacterales bacterium]|jgi:hypothetical protein